VVTAANPIKSLGVKRWKSRNEEGIFGDKSGDEE